MKFTCNQMIVLLDAYRRELRQANHLGTFTEDVNFLMRHGLMTGDYSLTPKGNIEALKALNVGHDRQVLDQLTLEQIEVIRRHKDSI